MAWLLHDVMGALTIERQHGNVRCASGCILAVVDVDETSKPDMTAAVAASHHPI